MSKNTKMSRVYFKLVYDPKNKEYTIDRMRSRNVDYSKITEKVSKFSRYIWVSRSKPNSEAYINTLKAERGQLN